MVAVIVQTTTLPLWLWVMGSLLLGLGYLIALAPSRRFAVAVGVATLIAVVGILIPCGWVTWPYC